MTYPGRMSFIILYRNLLKIWIFSWESFRSVLLWGTFESKEICFLNFNIFFDFHLFTLSSKFYNMSRMTIIFNEMRTLNVTLRLEKNLETLRHAFFLRLIDQSVSITKFQAFQCIMSPATTDLTLSSSTWRVQLPIDYNFVSLRLDR